MISPLIWAVGATILISFIAFAGIFTFALKDKVLRKILLLLVGFSAGALMGGAFLHLLPEAVEQSSLSVAGFSILAGFASFFVMERLLYWHHCHEGKCDVHMFTYMNLIGDTIHNLIDGLVIAASFVLSIPLGIATTIAVISHEIPQEIGDFGVLVYGGFSKLKALAFNFFTALTAVAGAFIGFFLSGKVEGITPVLLAFAAGGFIYIAASDLVPELHKEARLKKSMISFGFFLLGILLMYGTKILFEH